MFFFDKLRLLELLHQDEITTHLATDTATGRNYLLHWLPPDGSPQLARIMTILNELPEQNRELIVEVGRRNERAYLITQNPAAFSGLEPWLRSVRNFESVTPLEKKGTWKIPVELLAQPPDTKGEAALPGPEAASAVPEQPKQEPSEFTRMFIAPSSARDINTAKPSPATAEIHPAVIPPPAAPPEAGEFTRFLKAVPASQIEAHVPVTPRAEAPPAKLQPPGEPGEFTRLYSSPLPPEGATPPAAGAVMPALIPKPAALDIAPPVNKEPVGEFTRLIRAMPQAPEVKPAVPSDPRLEAPGHSDFTRMLGADAIGNDPFGRNAAGTLPPSTPPGDFTRLFNPGLGTTAPLGSNDRFPEAEIKRPEPASDYTRLFGRGEEFPERPRVAADNEATGIFARPVVPEPIPEPSAGPGDYTRLFAPPQTARPPAASSLPVAEPSSAKQPESKVLPAAKKRDPAFVIMLSALVLLGICALLVILYFALRK